MTAQEHFRTIEAGVRNKNKTILLVCIMSLYCTLGGFSVEELIQKISAILIAVLYQQTGEVVGQCIHLQNFLS